MIHFRKIILAASLGVALSGCMGNTISENINTFDNSKTISLAPTRGPDCEFAKCWLVGAEFNTASPDTIIVKTEIHRHWFGITQLFLNIDGEKVGAKAHGLSDLKTDKLTKTKITKGHFSFDRNYINKIQTAKMITGRAITTDGYSDFVLKSGNDTGHSYKNMVDFVNKVNKISN